MFCLIYKNNSLLSLEYKKQKLEAEIKVLADQKNLLQQQLVMLQNKSDVKEHAINHLGMTPVTLHHIHTLPA